MTINASPAYATAAAFQRAFNARLKTVAKQSGRDVNALRRLFLFQRFLALLFETDGHTNGGWVLKGGAGLLMRLPDARSSRDLDLYRSDGLPVEEAIAELRARTAARPGDHLRFVVAEGVFYSTANPVAQLSVDVYIGATRVDGFPIDLATELQMVAPAEQIAPAPVVLIPGLPDPPPITIYALADQAADKLCAMYERHGPAEAPSSRFRDLIDLALIVSTSTLEAVDLSAAVNAETSRRQLVLPTELTPPTPQWESGYNAYARKLTIPPDLKDFATTLAAVGACLDPILQGERRSGHWDPDRGWRD